MEVDGPKREKWATRLPSHMGLPDLGLRLRFKSGPLLFISGPLWAHRPASLPPTLGPETANPRSLWSVPPPVSRPRHPFLPSFPDVKGGWSLHTSDRSSPLSFSSPIHSVAPFGLQRVTYHPIVVLSRFLVSRSKQLGGGVINPNLPHRHAHVSVICIITCPSSSYRLYTVHGDTSGRMNICQLLYVPQNLTNYWLREARDADWHTRMSL